jgi:signal transduction histidine kinase
MASFLLASVFILSLLSIVVYYSNEILEDDLLSKQTDFELRHILNLLERDPQADLPKSASLNIYIASRAATQPIPGYLTELADGVHHDIKVDDKAYHILVVPKARDKIYLQFDITEIERSEGLLSLVLLIAWAVMIFLVFIIARILSKKLSGPVAELSSQLSRINPDQRGIQLSDRFEDDEVGRIAQAFDSYTRKMDDYVEKQAAFAAMASHELRSPLTIIKTSADLISFHKDDAVIDLHLQKIQRASSNMANMIHALLAVTRDSPTNNADEIIQLYPVIDEIIAASNAEILAKRIKVENNLERNISINSDKTLVTVVLSNLIRNAVRHGQDSSITITMEAQTLSVTDSGMGIDREELSNIFKLGYRGQNSQGYGIGLYISKLICDHKGWSLHLQKNNLGGTTASVGFSR